MDCCVADKCKQSFKGVENFLRKVAFNLGNSPSQTEVKIISCIPIDVSDLQQKIICLEKELDEAKAGKAEERTERVACCQEVQRGDVRASAATCYHDVQRASVAPCCQGALRGDGRSGAAQTTCVKLCEGACSRRSDDSLDDRYVPYARDPSEPHSYNQLMESETQCHSPGLFRGGKIKKATKKKGRCRTHLVYYAQANGGPFSDYQNRKRDVANAGIETRDPAISRTYIAEVIQKQYTAVPTKEFPASSRISSPVCRDVEPDPDRLAPNTTKTNDCESDVCSCLHGAFHDIDKNLPASDRLRVQSNPQPNCSYNNDSNNTDFYDTSLYDMVPVKEKAAKPPHLVQEGPKRRLHVADINTTQFVDRNHRKYRYHPFDVGYCKIPAAPANNQRSSSIKNDNKRDRNVKNIPNSKREEVMRELERNQEKNCTFDCSNVYVKRVHASVKEHPVLTSPRYSTGPRPTRPYVSHKNAECLTNNVKDMDCQTTTSQSVQIDNELVQDDNKTEDTLNQIKVILQTVLTEVKTNTHSKNIPEQKPTKDAIVQKGLSQAMMPGCSSILNSFSYSPYNINPYGPSCSRQMNPSAACYAHVPYGTGKCLHNYPVFIQSPVRNMCSCYRNSSFTKDGKPKNAATTATNTETKERSKETEKLIKEIYKSIKVNMDVPNKDTSASEHDGQRSATRSLDVNHVREEGINIFVKSSDPKRAARQASTTPLSFNNRFSSNTMSLRSQQIISTTDTEKYLRNNRIESYLENLNKEKQNKIDEENESRSPTTSEESSEEEETEEGVVVPTEQSEKKEKKGGIFSKMFKGRFKLFKSKPKKNEKKEEEIQVDETEDEESEAESDDYQTIYSQVEEERTARQVSYPVRLVKPKAHSKISFSRHMRDVDQRRLPYMEQEYRRQWNENLMFRNNPHRHSSEVAPTRETDLRNFNPTYWRDVEARSALIGHDHNRRLVDAAVAPSLPLNARKKVTLKIPKKTSMPKFKAGKGLAWLKRHKPACTNQLKKIILES